jgi:hypothetical protein
LLADFSVACFPALKCGEDCHACSPVARRVVQRM